MINPSIFKLYDIRGIYPEELNEEAAFSIGRAFVAKTGAKKVVLAYDARLSSRVLFDSLARGINQAGADIYDIGQKPTECLYFAVGAYDADAGVMVTASHNPKEYNGFKMIKKEGRNPIVIRGKDLLAEIELLPSSTQGPGKVLEKDIWSDFFKHIFSFTNIKKISPFKVVVDASNGVAGIVIEKIKDKLPVKIIPLNFDPNGNFPNHSPNPLLEGSANQIKEEIKKQSANFGFIFDGDADRIFLVDEVGNFIRADITLLLLAKHFLEKNPGATIAYNAICSKAVPEFIKKWRGNPIRTQVGFVNVQHALLQNNGVMGGELSGHYCFKDNFYLDSGMAAFLILIQVISEDGRKVSEIVKELSPYFKSAEINMKVPTAELSRILDEVGKKYADGKQDFLDGVTVEYKDWWFNIRPSNTEPLLRLTIEADAQEMLSQKQKELTEFIKN